MIFLIRHGEAAAGWGEHSDPGLSQLGHEQADAVAKVLLGLGVADVVSSPMQRCRETAAPLAKHIGKTPRIEPTVSEISIPSYVSDRVTWLQNLMTRDWPETMRPWCENAYQAVTKVRDGTAIFSHFVAINAIVGRITNDPRVLQFRPGHCSITQLQADGTGNLSVAELGVEGVTRITL